MEGYILIFLNTVLIGIILFVAFYLFRFLFKYEITEKNIRILLFRFIPIYKIQFSKIEKTYIARFHEVFLIPGLHFLRLPFRKTIVIEMRDTMIKFAFLTPDDPDAFISEIKKHLANFSE